MGCFPGPSLTVYAKDGPPQFRILEIVGSGDRRNRSGWRRVNGRETKDADRGGW
jgi:hypothetical protein